MLLPVQVTFRNVEDSIGLEEMVRKEAATLYRFYDRISRCRVLVERPQHAATGKLYHIRIDLGLPNDKLVVKHTPAFHGTLQDTKTEKSRTEADSVLVRPSSPGGRNSFLPFGRPDGGHRQEGHVAPPARLY